MNAIGNFIKSFFWLILGVVGVAAAALYLLNSQKEPSLKIPVYNQLPTFTFTSHAGATFGLQQMQGKVNVVDFIFTNCGAACPLMTTEMSKLYKHFAKTPGIQFVSISVDPENDTIARLREYARGYGVADNRWSFLRGPLKEVSTLAENGFMLSGDFPANHSTKFILVDQKARVRGYYDSYEPDSIDLLKKHLKQLSR